MVEPDDTVETLYNRFLYPEGIKALVFTFVFLPGAPIKNNPLEHSNCLPIITAMDTMESCTHFYINKQKNKYRVCQ